MTVNACIHAKRAWNVTQYWDKHKVHSKSE